MLNQLSIILGTELFSNFQLFSDGNHQIVLWMGIILLQFGQCTVYLRFMLMLLRQWRETNWQILTYIAVANLNNHKKICPYILVTKSSNFATKSPLILVNNLVNFIPKYNGVFHQILFAEKALLKSFSHKKICQIGGRFWPIFPLTSPKKQSYFFAAPKEPR